LANHRRNASGHGYQICHPHPHDHGFQTSSCCQPWPQRNYRETSKNSLVFTKGHCRKEEQNSYVLDEELSLHYEAATLLVSYGG